MCFVFRRDPYPHLEPLMEQYDILATENRAFEHINSGFLWMKKSQTTADAWNEVLQMDLKETSRDQYNFNTVSRTRYTSVVQMLTLDRWDRSSELLKLGSSQISKIRTAYLYRTTTSQRMD